MAVRNDFTAGEVLAAADLNDTFASKVDYATPTNAQTGTAYTFVAADAEKLTTASNGSAVTLTIPPASSVAWPDETILRVVNYGAGAVTIDGGSGVTVTNTASTIAQYGAAVAIRTGSDAWTVVPFGGGDVPSATVSSPAATGQYTDGSGDTWDYFTFTSSGTLTVDTAGFADVLVVGGGGGGGARNGGPGGGGGGFEYATNLYLEATSYTVTIGAGGGANAVGAGSRLGSILGAGGGGGAIGDNGNRGASGSGGVGNGSGTGGASFIGQGNNGGNGGGTGGGGRNGGGGGGGATAAGSNGTSETGGAGGAGTANSITGSSVTRSGGGGGGFGNDGGGDRGGGAGGAGGGGAGGGSTGPAAGTSGTANTGGGGGGSGFRLGTTASAGSGGSGVIIIRVKV